MANCHNLFAEYNKNISLNTSKKERLKKSKDALREKILGYFREHHPNYKPEFFIQGSYKNGTIIRTKDDECDLDDGVFFHHEVNVNGETLQGWILKAVYDHTSTPPQHKKKCIRVIYKGDYHIDLPVFKYVEGEDDHPQLAVRNEKFTDDDPKEFVNWYKGIRTSQLTRIVKYLKAWSDHKSYNLPGGLEMTILAAESYVENERDDIALLDTLQSIQDNLDDRFECVMKTTPHEDLFEDYSSSRKDNFLSALDSFISDGEKAVENPKQTESCKKWAKHLGSRFPCDKAVDEEPQSTKSAVRINQTAKSA